MFQAILFDFDGTLVDFVAADIQSLKWLHSHTGSTVEFDDFLETAVAKIMSFHDLAAQNETDPLLMHSDKSLYVGDSITHDVIGAKSAGMKTVLLSQKAKRSSGIADYVVSDIGELHHLLF